MINKKAEEIKRFNGKRTMIIRLIMIFGLILLVSGIVLFFLSCFGTRIRDDYTKKSTTEYDIVEVTGIAIDSKNNIYCLSNYLSAVNVYSENGDFLYSLVVPDYQNGGCEMFIKNGSLFIQNKSHNIYSYVDGIYKGKVECDFEKGRFIRYDQNNNFKYSIQYVNDEYDYYLPLYFEDDFLFVLDYSNNLLYTYEKEMLSSEESYDNNNPLIIYASKKVVDKNGNIYGIEGIIPKLVKNSVAGDVKTIAKITFWNWARQNSFVGLAIGIVGLLMLIVPQYLEKC